MLQTQQAKWAYRKKCEAEERIEELERQNAKLLRLLAGGTLTLRRRRPKR